jgi:hypothetical protein
MEPSDEGQCDAQGEKVCESEQDQVASSKQRCRKHDRREAPGKAAEEGTPEQHLFPQRREHGDDKEAQYDERYRQIGDPGQSVVRRAGGCAVYPQIFEGGE